jgi:hypothetical protein
LTDGEYVAVVYSFHADDRERAYSIVSFFSFSFLSSFFSILQKKKTHVSTPSGRLAAWKKETRIAPSLSSRDSRSLFD